MAGIYIHIPFCKKACTYCNFHFSTSLAQKEDLVKSLIREIIISGDFIPEDEPINTIYFGGGTPSLLSSAELALIFDTLYKKFRIDHDAEITVEANPDDVSKNVLKEWTSLGINRLSLGVQSFKEKELKWMNRAHNAIESLKSIDEIQQSGITNFSVDLIYGSPILDNRELEYNLQIIFDKNIPHISCYALTVEPKTALHKFIEQKKAAPVNSGKQAGQFLLLMAAMKERDYEHYEISNFAKPGMRSRHNSSYWQGKPYYGFGPAAHSFDGKNRRRWNIANNALYIQSLKENKIPYEEEMLTKTQQLNEYIMTSLRTVEGVDTKFIGSEFGAESEGKLRKAVQKYINNNKINVRNNHIALTDEGKLFADGIAADIFF